MLTFTMIARNAAGTIERCLRSVDPYVDRMVIVFAGESTDDTEAVVDRTLMELRRGSDTVDVLHFGPSDNPEAFFPDGDLADFSAARNMALSRVPDGSHWLYMDADDEALLTPEQWDEARAMLDDGRAGAITIRYDYSHDDYGEPTSQHNQVRFFTGVLDDWHWEDRVHEWCKTEGNAPIVRMKDAPVKHHRTEKQSERNVRILELMLQERPGYKRALLHLGDAYYGMERWAEALDAYAAYYEAPELEPHGFHAASQAAKSAMELRDWPLAAQWALSVVDMRPDFKDGYLLRARVAEEMGEHVRALHWLDGASDKLENTNDTAIVVYVHDYTWNAWDCHYKALAGLQRWTEAKAVAALALRHYPKNHAWFRQLQLAAEGERIEKSVLALAQLTDHFVRRGDTLKAWELLQDQRLPMTVRDDARIHGLRAQVWGAVRHVFNPAAYKEFYDDDTDHRCVGTAVDSYRLRPILESLKRRGVKKVLDVACGQGGPLMWLADRLPGVEFVGIDINKHLVEASQENLRERGLEDRVRIEHGNIYDYAATHQLEDFDAVTMIELIEHMRPEEAQRQITQAEELGDAVFCTTPAMFCSDIPGLDQPFPRDHVLEYSRSDIEQIVFRVPRRRPVEIRKVWAPDEDLEQDIAYMFPGFATWLLEFDNTSRHRPPVVFYLGQGPNWKPTDIEEVGLGGSETMAVRMAEQFARNNHPVVVYADWTGVHNAVIYRHWSEFKPERPYMGVDAWLFISSRAPGVFEQRVNADICWLWCHDVDYGDEVTAERLENVGRVLVLSEWHRQHWLETYPWFPEEKLVVTSNAIDPEALPALEEMPERQQHRFIWPSSADRGLDKVLELWPKIRATWEDAELHVYYGWETAELLMQAPGREWLREYQAKVMEAARQPGVVWHGRVSQPELYREMAKAQFWLYPSVTPFGPWNETFCIAAVEALAMGVMPVVRQQGALPERLADVDMADFAIRRGASDVEWLNALRRWDRMPTAERIAWRRERLLEKRSAAAVFREWMRLVLQTQVEDAQRGEVTAAESMLVTPT